MQWHGRARPTTSTHRPKRCETQLTVTPRPRSPESPFVSRGAGEQSRRRSRCRELPSGKRLGSCTGCTPRARRGRRSPSRCWPRPERRRTTPPSPPGRAARAATSRSSRARAAEPARTAAPLRAPCSVLRAPGLTARVHGSQEHEVPGLRAAPAAIRQGRQSAQRLRLLR